MIRIVLTESTFEFCTTKPFIVLSSMKTSLHNI